MITSLNIFRTKISVGFLLLLYCFSLNALDGLTPPHVIDDLNKQTQSGEQPSPSHEVPAPIKKIVLTTGVLTVGALIARKYLNRSLDLLRKEMNTHFAKVHQRFDTVDTRLEEIKASLAAHSKTHQEAISSSEKRVTGTITDAHAATGTQLDAIEKKLDLLTVQKRS